MTQTQITDAMLFRFFAGQLTEEETVRLKAWMDENPEEHQKVMKKAHDIYVLGVMYTAFESPDQLGHSRSGTQIPIQRITDW